MYGWTEMVIISQVFFSKYRGLIIIDLHDLISTSKSKLKVKYQKFEVTR